MRRDQIYPGMPVETYIGTGDRTFVEYLVRPLLDSFGRAFREIRTEQSPIFLAIAL